MRALRAPWKTSGESSASSGRVRAISGLPRVLRDAVFDPQFRQDLRYWVETNPRVALRILDLVEAALRDPFSGIGRPEPLQRNLRGEWSRRINQEHRLTYFVSASQVVFTQARYHYERR